MKRKEYNGNRYRNVRAYNDMFYNGSYLLSKRRKILVEFTIIDYVVSWGIVFMVFALIIRMFN